METVEDPVNQITLDEARRIDPAAEIGSEIRIPKTTDALGRISAQTAKQVILQKVREAERETVYPEFSGPRRRTGQLHHQAHRGSGPGRGHGQDRSPAAQEGTVPAGKLHAWASASAASSRASRRPARTPGVIVSRAAPELVMRLFEQEVPEIYDNTVIIKACAREAGERTKIAVQSRDRDVDSVGACVGMKGMRVQSIIRELRGEKIDIIEFSDDPVAFATHALSPAKISRVSIVDATERHMEVIVDDSQLSLAIGKKGQNVRLAAKLLGWRIDIKSEEEKRQEVESPMAALVVPGAPVSVLIDHGLTEKLVEKLLEAGVGTVEKLGAMTPEQLEAIRGHRIRERSRPSRWPSTATTPSSRKPGRGERPATEAPGGSSRAVPAGVEPTRVAGSRCRRAVEAPVDANRRSRKPAPRRDRASERSSDVMNLIR